MRVQRGFAQVSGSKMPQNSGRFIIVNFVNAGMWVRALRHHRQSDAQDFLPSAVAAYIRHGRVGTFVGHVWNFLRCSCC